MKRLFTILPLLATAFASAQSSIDTLYVTRNQAETAFLQNNVQLLAEKLHIDIAEAKVIQAKVWPNPNLSISEVNIWKNGSTEQLPALWGNYGRTQEITAGLEQLIITAGKRKKMIAMEKVGVQMANEYFKDFLSNLKIEFRNTLTALQYNQGVSTVYKKQLGSMQKLIAAYKNQVTEGNMSRAEYIRLKAEELKFIKELNELQLENNNLQKELKRLMFLNPSTYVKIDNDGFVPNIKAIDNLNVATLTETAIANRPDVKYTKLAQEYSDKKYRYERALRTPNVTVDVSYDRAGNIMRDFVGIGFSVDLPFFDRNQGNIKAARAEAGQSKLLAADKANTASAQVVQAYSDLLSIKNMYEGLEDNYEGELDMLLDSYMKNFVQRNTSLLEYLDFVNAYLENKSILLTTQRNLNEHLEELRYMSGEELN